MSAEDASFSSVVLSTPTTSQHGLDISCFADERYYYKVLGGTMELQAAVTWPERPSYRPMPANPPLYFMWQTSRIARFGFPANTFQMYKPKSLKAAR